MKMNLPGPASKYRMITGVVGICLIMVYQNCAQNGFESTATNSAAQSVTALSNSVTAPQAYVECQNVTPTILQARIKNLLGIIAGDVPVLDDNGNPTGVTRLASELSALGQGDPANGIPNDFSCSTPKFKDAIEIMIDACTIGLKTPRVQTLLFPLGPNNYAALYQAFIGRAPTSDEIAILQQLTSGMGAQAETAACSAVAASLQSLISI